MSSPHNPQTFDETKHRLSQIGDQARANFANTHAAREKLLHECRKVIRNSANSIRATHRGEFRQARKILDDTTVLLKQLEDLREIDPRIYFTGTVEDSHKEFAEAEVTLAFAECAPLPDPHALGIGDAPYLNGLAEAIGELRRFILDSLRRDDFSRCEELLNLMDEAYTVLVTMDYPDAVTRGLRRSTDMVRGILERTRGDLTIALRQQRTEEKLAKFQRSIDDKHTQG